MSTRRPTRVGLTGFADVVEDTDHPLEVAAWNYGHCAKNYEPHRQIMNKYAPQILKDFIP